MATICTHCGLEVPAGSSVCPACGETVKPTAPAFTPVVEPGTQYGAPVPPPAAAAPSAPPYTAPSYTAPSYTAPPPPASSGGGAVKIILIVVGVFVFLGILAAAVVGIGVWRVSKSIVHKNANGDVSISTPGGTITSGSAISESDLGIAIYPGATRANSSSMNMHTPGGSLVSAAFLTSDSPQQVIDFYKSKIGSDSSDVSSMQSGKSTMLTSGGDNKDKVMVTVTAVDNGKTRITILHTTKK